jgi:parallel beta-helix repeat protein
MIGNFACPFTSPRPAPVRIAYSMSSSPRDVLSEIVAKYGEPLLSSPLRCHGLLKDFCGDSRREIFVLVSCVRLGLVDQLRQQSGPSIIVVCARLALKLEQNLAISSDIAKWAVESWALAIGLLRPEAAAAPVKETVHSPDPAPPENVPAEKPRPENTVSAAKEDEAPAAEKEPAMEFLAYEPESHWPVPDWAHPAESIAVYPDGSDLKPTLREAVRAAAPNTCLLLAPGIYRESLIIKKDLQLRPADALGGVALESLSASVIVLDGACLFVSRIGLRGLAGKDKKVVPAVDVRAGHLVMEDCDLTSEASTVIEVKGPESEAVLRRCHLHDGKAGGILFREEAGGYLEECHLYQNKLSQVVIGKGCSPTIFSCKISHAQMSGIYVSEGGSGLIENCDIWGNAVGGIQCWSGGNPRIRHCRISMNERYGVLIAEKGEGFFEQCQIFDNARMGVTVSQHSKPRFSECQIFDNRGLGVELDEQAESEWLDCEIFNNEGINVVIKDKSEPRFYRCVIHDGGKEGLQITGESKGYFEQCEFFANALAGVSVAEDSSPLFQRCVFHHGMESGIHVDGAEGQFIDCEITHHAGAAVRIGDKSQPHFERCHVTGNQAAGLHVDEAGAPTFLSCVVTQNGGAGIVVQPLGGGTVKNCEVTENAGGDWNISDTAQLTRVGC